MFGRTTLFLGILILAAALPYVLSNPKWNGTVARGWNRLSHSVRGQMQNASTGTGNWATGSVVNSTTPHHDNPGLPGHPIATSQIVGPPGISLADLLRFDITPEWILSNWSRVTTVLADPQLHGMRVAFMTGTELASLAGTLTYYYDQNRQLRRITLQAYTGDVEPLVSYLRQFYGLQSAPQYGANVWVAAGNDTPLHLLRVQYLPVVRGDAPRARYQVFVELNAQGA